MSSSYLERKSETSLLFGEEKKRAFTNTFAHIHHPTTFILAYPEMLFLKQHVLAQAKANIEGLRGSFFGFGDRVISFCIGGQFPLILLIIMDASGPFGAVIAPIAHSHSQTP